MKELPIASSDELVVPEQHGGVLILTLNRPALRNAINVAMIEALSLQLERAEKRPEVRCIVLTGSGSAFCSGGDVRSMGANTRTRTTPDATTQARAKETLREAQRRTALRLYQSSKPTLASLPGAAVGAGLSWALACDLRIMSETASLATGFAKLGLSGDHGGLFFLNRLVGRAKTLELFLLSRKLPAKEALALGLTNWVCPPTDLFRETIALATQLAEGAPLAHRFIKENLTLAEQTENAEAYMDKEAERQIAAMQTEDFREAVLAFSEKRAPRFSGK